MAIVLAGRAVAAAAPTTEAPEPSKGPAASEAPLDPAPPPIEVTVRAAPPPMSAGAVTISAPEVERARLGSGSELLALAPGLRIVQHGAEGKGHQIFLRGFDAAHGSDVEVTMAGIVLNERGNVHGQGYVDLYGVIPEAVREIRVEKGSFLPEQGDFATAGSVRFELGIPAEYRPGLVRTELGTGGRQRTVVAVAPEDGPAGSFAASEAVYDPGFGPNRTAVRTSLLAAHEWPIAGDADVGALLSAQLARWQSPGVARLDAVEQGRRGFYDAIDPAGRGDSDRLLGRLGYTHDDGESRVELVGFAMARTLAIEENYTGFLLHSLEGDRKRQAEGAVGGGAFATASRELSFGFPATLLSGAGWQSDWVAQSEQLRRSDRRPWRTTRDLGVTTHVLHAYAGLRLRPLRWLEILPSIRGDLCLYRLDDRLGTPAAAALGVPSPRVAARLPVTGWLQLFAGYGRGFRSPEPRSIGARTRGTVEDESLAQYQGGEPRITTADSVELGTLVGDAEWLELRAAGFATWIEREVVFDHVSNTNLELDGTRRLGIEAAARSAPLDWLEVGLEATLLSAEFLRSEHPIPGSSPWFGRATLHAGQPTGPHGGAELAWTAARSLANGASVAGFALLDLSVGWRSTRHDWTLAVDNALGAEVMDGAYHYASWFERSEPTSAIPAIHYTAGRPVTGRFVWTAWL